MNWIAWGAVLLFLGAGAFIALRVLLPTKFDRACQKARKDGYTEDWGSETWYDALARHGGRIDDPDLRSQLRAAASKH